MVRLDNDAYAFERALAGAGFGPVAGADEAGRGASAGPLVAAAVILDPDNPIEGLDDSKKLTAKRRDTLFDKIREQAVAVAIAEITPAECDALGMHHADLHGLRRAVLKLDVAPNFVLTDGFSVDGLGVPGLAMWKGDKVAACMSAASIIAKVTRDRIMESLDDEYPEYGFRGHKGYNTKAHQQALEQYGPCPEHRMRFANVRAAKALHGG